MINVWVCFLRFLPQQRHLLIVSVDVYGNSLSTFVYMSINFHDCLQGKDFVWQWLPIPQLQWNIKNGFR
jgi:hypothetical protein